VDRQKARRRAAAAAAAVLLVLGTPALAQAHRRHHHRAQDPVHRLLALVNHERRLAGCRPVTLNRRLDRAARLHSEDMADNGQMSHRGSDGSSGGDRMEDAGYDPTSWGENVAYGYRTPEQVMHGWMHSRDHRRNILDCRFREMGLGHAQPGNFWTQEFARAS